VPSDQMTIRDTSSGMRDVRNGMRDISNPGSRIAQRNYHRKDATMKTTRTQNLIVAALVGALVC